MILLTLKLCQSKTPPQAISKQALATAMSSEAEGTGLEPATPYGALHLQSGNTCKKPKEKRGSRPTCQQIASSAREVPQDLQALINVWPALPEAIKAGILAMVRAAAPRT